MKYIVFLMVLFLTACNRLPGHNIHYAVPFEYMEDCELGKGSCQPVVLTRKGANDRVILQFPGGGTETDVYFYSQVPVALLFHERKFAGEGAPAFDLSGLPDGHYTAKMRACAVGGDFEVQLLTKP